MGNILSGSENKEERKLALVIGINDYDNFSLLSNSENNAHDIASTLGNIGFTVTMGFGLEHAEMKSMLNEFQKSIKENDLVLVYFSGHGLYSKVCKRVSK